MSASYRLSLLAAIGCLGLAACDGAAPPPASDAQGAPSAAKQEQPVASSVEAAPVLPMTLTELDDAAKSVKTSATGMCRFDKINGEPIGDATSVIVRTPAEFSVAGWLVDKEQMVRPEGVLRLQEVNGTRAWEISVGPGTSRGDVGRYLKQEALKNAGFEVKVDISSLPAGEYALTLDYYAGDRRVVCDKGKKIRIES